jgi:Uma2 family endonuclease
MALAPSPASIPSHLTAAPLMLPWDLRLTPEQLERVCQANPEAVLELAADGQLIAMTPTGGETGARCLRLGHGASLGWLLLPHERTVDIWRGGQRGRAERLENASRLDGGELAAGLVLNLQEIWAI